jgi:hypothetical protein
MAHDDELCDPRSEEHECSRPLEQPVEAWYAGDQFFSPAGRWEIVTENIDLRRDRAAWPMVTVHTDQTGLEYGWSFWPGAKFPHLPGWSWRPERRVMTVVEIGRRHIEARVVPESAAGRLWDDAGCHEVVSASAAAGPGAGWVVTDRPDGGALREQRAKSKAAARALVRRLAREHAGRLGVPVWRRPRPEAGS